MVNWAKCNNHHHPYIFPGNLSIRWLVTVCSVKTIGPRSEECASIHIAYISVITNSDLNRPCFAWHPYGKSGLFKTELVIVSPPHWQ